MKKSILVLILLLTTSTSYAISWEQVTDRLANGCVGYKPNIDTPSRDSISTITNHEYRRDPQSQNYQNENPYKTGPAISHQSPESEQENNDY